MTGSQGAAGRGWELRGTHPRHRGALQGLEQRRGSADGRGGVWPGEALVSRSGKEEVS